MPGINNGAFVIKDAQGNIIVSEIISDGKFHTKNILQKPGYYDLFITGDIEKEVEQALLEQNALGAVDVLFAPHHGSHTSSTFGFVAKTHPRYVVYSAGYHNQHGHPHQDVQDRYSEIGSIPLNTAYSGALEFVWDGELNRLTQYRHSARRYWFDVGAQ